MTWKPFRADRSSCDRISHLASELRDRTWIDQTEDLAWLLNLAEFVRLCPDGVEPSFAFDVESRLASRLASEYRQWEQMSWDERFDRVDRLKSKRQRQEMLSGIFVSPRQVDADAHAKLIEEAQQ